MQIKELHLVNFGKFTNKKIELDSKMTIIYGENETGKSTIFHFIVGMFYGFYKPYVKNRKLLDIHETYNPWSGGGYSGSLLFYDDLSKRDLRIERNFTQGQEFIKVFVERSGDEITDDYDSHPIYRLPDVAAKHIGVSYATFINTLAIKQLGHETDENLEKELKETVVNALSTHNSDVSVNKVQDKITKELKAIGSSRRKTSTYYLKKQKIRALTNELSKSIEIHNDIRHSKDEGKELIKEKDIALVKLAQIKTIEIFRELKDKESLIDQGRKINTTLAELKAKQKELNISSEFSIQEVEKAIEDSSQLNFVLKQNKKINKDLEDIESEVAELKGVLNKPQTSVDDETLEKLTKDIYICSTLSKESRELSKEIGTLKSKQDKCVLKLKNITTDNEQLIRHKKTGVFIGFVSIMILIISVIFMSQTYVLVIGVMLGIIGVILGIFMFLSYTKKLGKAKNDNQQITNDYKNSDVFINEQKTLLSEKENQVTKILENYNVEDLPSLISFKDKCLKEAMAEASIIKIYESQLINFEKLKAKRKVLIESKDELSTELIGLEHQLQPITSYYQTVDIEGLKKVKERLAEFLLRVKTIEYEELRLKDLLKHQSLITIEVDLEKCKANFNKELDVLNNKNPIDEKWLTSFEALEMIEKKAAIAEIVSDVDQKLAGIQSKSEALGRGHRCISEVEEELETEKELLQTLDFKKQVFELIGTTIETITDELQHNFAPLLNESVTKMVETITDNKYQDIKINPQMLMRLKDPETHQMINATQLSRGTMDLFYLALRDALATWINKDKELPILLDETFAHFDDVRLETALTLFSKSERQVILFTCQKREVELSKKAHHGTIISL